MSAPRSYFATVANPKISLGMTLRNGLRVLGPKQKRRNRKLEAHEVIAKLKARKRVSP
jgi:hypothetical protein